MNVEKNEFEQLAAAADFERHESEPMNRHERRKLAALERRSKLVRPNGEPVPDHWPIFTVGELVTVKNYTFKVAYIGESTLLLEPTGPLLVGDGNSK